MSEIDVQHILSDASAIAYPRFPGTDGDRRCIEWLHERFLRLGLDVRLQWFNYDMRPAWRALRILLVSAAILIGLASALASRTQSTAVALLAVALIAGTVFLAWAPGLEKLYQREGSTRTANLIASRPARGNQPRLRLIFLAHHDSKSQNLAFPARAGLTVAALFGTLGLCGLLVAQLLAGDPPGPAWLAPAAGGLAAAALLGLSTLTSGNLSPGGVDNAGSVGILLELARLLPATLPQDVELTFLSPGAEEDHMVGAMRWLDENAAVLLRSEIPVLALNFDGAGIPGRIALLERYGLGQRFSATLSTAARRAARKLGIPVRGVFLPPAMGVDAIPFVHRGIECLTIASGSLGRATFAIHSANDVAENLDAKALQKATALATEMARELT